MPFIEASAAGPVMHLRPAEAWDPPLLREAAPEIRLVLACAARDYSGERQGQVSGLSRTNVDWQRVCSFARRHRLIPLLYRALHSHHSAEVPADIFALLREEYTTNARESLAITQELLRVYGVLQEHGVECVAYKGPTLAGMLYGDVALRSYNDVDLILDRRDVPRASELLSRHGYSAELPLTESEYRLYLAAECELNFVHQSGVQVELHWQIAPRYCAFDFPPASLLTGTVPVALGASELRTLAPEVLLICLCVHGLKHGWPALGHIVDIGELAAPCRGLNWVHVFDTAQELGATRALLQGLGLARGLCGIPLPAQAEAMLERHRARLDNVPALARRLIQDSPPLSETGRAHLLYRSRERFSDRLRFLWRLFFCPNTEDVLFLPLPKAMFWAYPGVRLARLALKSAVAAGLVSSRVSTDMRKRTLSKRATKKSEVH